MNSAEARDILRAHLEPFRRRSYQELTAMIGQEPTVSEVIGASGVVYQLEIQAMWDDHPGAEVRVMGSVDDGGWRSLAPLGDDFIMAPNGSFVGEEPASAYRRSKPS